MEPLAPCPHQPRAMDQKIRGSPYALSSLKSCKLAKPKPFHPTLSIPSQENHNKGPHPCFPLALPASWPVLVLPHASLSGMPCLLSLRICEHKNMLLHDSLVCPCVLLYVIKTNLGTFQNILPQMPTTQACTVLPGTSVYRGCETTFLRSVDNPTLHSGHSRAHCKGAMPLSYSFPKGRSQFSVTERKRGENFCLDNLLLNWAVVMMLTHSRQHFPFCKTYSFSLLLPDHSH